MSATSPHRLLEMQVLMTVAREGNFSAAANALGLTPSAVSKLVGRLEERLGAQLVVRTTRKTRLTVTGEQYVERARTVLALVDEAEAEASGRECLGGRIRVSANVPVARHFLLPSLPLFARRYPQIAIDLSLSDRIADLFAEPIDVAIRTGPLTTGSLVARLLGSDLSAVVASPAYLAAHGVPATPDELAAHRKLGFAFSYSGERWPFRLDGSIVNAEQDAWLRLSDGDSLLQAAVDGLGIARLARFQVADKLADGSLVELLAPFNPLDRQCLSAVFAGRSRRLPGHVRVFLDHLSEHVRLR